MTTDTTVHHLPEPKPATSAQIASIEFEAAHDGTTPAITHDEWRTRAGDDYLMYQLVRDIMGRDDKSLTAWVAGETFPAEQWVRMAEHLKSKIDHARVEIEVLEAAWARLFVAFARLYPDDDGDGGKPMTTEQRAEVAALAARTAA